MAPLNDAQARERMAELPGWSLDAGAIRRQFTFSGFGDAVAFLVRLGYDAEAADHHPDITINYKRVTLTYSTHSEGGLTEKDFAGASMATALAGRMGGK